MAGKCIYSHNEDFFSKETPEVFYWAGFIAADGCISHNNGSIYLKLEISRKDEKHLVKFKKAIQFTGNIKRIKQGISFNGIGYNSSRLEITITNSCVIKDLEKFNIVPKKSLIYTFPEWLEKHPLVNHFMRGYFDGDGSVSSTLNQSQIKNRSKNKTLRMSLRGTESFLNSFQNVLINNGIISHKNTINKSSKIGQISYNGNRIVFKISKYLYSGSNICLDRKYKIIYNGYYNNMPENFSNKSIQSINIKSREVKKFKSISDAAKFYNFSGSWIGICIKKNKIYNGFIWKLLKGNKI